MSLKRKIKEEVIPPMVSINITATDTKLCLSHTVIPSGNRKTYELNITFDSDWDEFAKTVTFVNDNNVSETYKVLVSNNKAIIPHEVLIDEGNLHIGIRGVSGDKVKTTNIVSIKVIKGTPEGTITPSEPTPNVYEQILNSYNSIDGRVTNLAKLSNGSTTGDAELIDGRYGADGVTYSTLGTAVRTQISNLSNEIGNLNLDNGYRDTSSTSIGALTEAQGYKSLLIDVIAGEKITLIGYGTSQARLWATIDKNGTIVRRADANSHPVSPLEIIIANGEERFCFNTYLSGDYYCKIDDVITNKNTIIKKLNEAKNNILDASTSIANINQKFNAVNVIRKYTDITGSLISKKFVSASGVVSDADTSTYFVSGYIEVQEGETYKISAVSNWGNALYCFYDSNYSVRLIGTIAASSGTLTIISDIEVIVPTQAKYIVVAGNTNSLVNASIKKFDGYMLPKKWQGKKWVCIGDSLTEVNTKTTKHYHDYIGEATGISVVNMGVSGTGYMRLKESNKAFYQRVTSIPIDADVVTIFGSGNDLGSSYTLGSPTDTGTDTICGCINTTINTIIGLMPKVSLGIIAPTPWIGYPPSESGNVMELYVQALETICNNRSIPFLDLYHSSNLRPWTEEGRTACYSKDEENGVHPDEGGHKLIAPRFNNLLESLLM